MPSELKDKVKESLMREQGDLCAYCMKRIPQKNVSAEISVTIEHWDAQHANDDDKGLDYRNMLAVCSGNRGHSELCCDAQRGALPPDKQALTVNPLKQSTLTEISYSSNGKIQSLNPDVDIDLNKKLNLNSERIGFPEMRKQALQTLQKVVQKEHPTGDISLYCERLLERYMSEEEKQPFVGILMWWLRKKTRKN